MSNVHSAYLNCNVNQMYSHAHIVWCYRVVCCRRYRVTDNKQWAQNHLCCISLSMCRENWAANFAESPVALCRTLNINNKWINEHTIVHCTVWMHSHGSAVFCSRCIWSVADLWFVNYLRGVRIATVWHDLRAECGGFFSVVDGLTTLSQSHRESCTNRTAIY